jgi:asparagine synthetase B (glutamine-hydrolysing)
VSGPAAVVRPPDRSPLERAAGIVLGSVPLALPPGPPRPPRRALEEVLLAAMDRRGPVGVAFSGGRDSSAVLALAIHLARREGLDEPVALTRRYLGVPEAEEDAWQLAVVRHLGVREWVHHPVRDELDALGPVARPLLERFGPLWPPVAHQAQVLLPYVRGGVLLTGEGGDTLFGSSRSSTLLRLGVRRQRISRAALRQLARELSPYRRRRRVTTELLLASTFGTWLQAPARRAAARALATDLAAEPFDWRGSCRWRFGRRGSAEGVRFTQALAREQDVALVHLFHEPTVLAAYLTSVGRLGPRGRGDAMQAVVGDLLPRRVLWRTDKARFNRAIFAGHTRAFVDAWDGTTPLAPLVDTVKLRAAWLSASPPAGSLTALQETWLAHRP